MLYCNFKLEWTECQKLAKQLNDIFEPLWKWRPIIVDGDGVNERSGRREFYKTIKETFDWCRSHYKPGWEERLGIPPLAIKVYEGLGKSYVNTGLQLWEDIAAGRYSKAEMQFLARYVLSMALSPGHPLVREGRLNVNESFLGYKRAARDCGLSETNYDKILRPLKERGVIVDTHRRWKGETEDGRKWASTIIKRINLHYEKGEELAEEPRPEPRPKPNLRVVKEDEGPRRRYPQAPMPKKRASN